MIEIWIQTATTWIFAGIAGVALGKLKGCMSKNKHQREDEYIYVEGIVSDHTIEIAMLRKEIEDLKSQVYSLRRN